MESGFVVDGTQNPGDARMEVHTTRGRKSGSSEQGVGTESTGHEATGLLPPTQERASDSQHQGVGLRTRRKGFSWQATRGQEEHGT